MIVVLLRTSFDFFFSSRRRHTRFKCDWSSDVCSSDLGFSENTLADAQMIAKLGYVVFAEDIFGKGVVPKDVPEMTKLIAIYNNDRPLMRARALAGFDVLKAQPMVDPARLASVGYCFGGTVGIQLLETRTPLLGFRSAARSFRTV